MNTNEHELHPEHIRNPQVNYERHDLSARGVLFFFIALAIAAVLMHFILWGMFRYLGRGRVAPLPPSEAISTPERIVPGGNPARAFPAPQLQPDPVADLNRFRAQQDQVLESYGWVDKDKGIVRIPIDRAMQVLVQRGLPTRQPGPAPSAAPAVSRQQFSATALRSSAPVRK